MSTTMHAPPRDWKEGRRLRALELFEQGWKQVRIAEALGVTRGAVSQWLKRAREGGREALRHRPLPGRQPRLSPEQRAQVPALLATGAEAYGFIGAVWTTERVATVIAREFGVHHHPAHVSRILATIGWSLQKPMRRATQRDEQAIHTGATSGDPLLKQSPRGGPHDRLGRRGRILSAALRRPHLCAVRPDTHLVRAADAGSPVGH